MATCRPFFFDVYLLIINTMHYELGRTINIDAYNNGATERTSVVSDSPIFKWFVKVLIYER
jgi:hypothetical protein